MQPTVPPAHSGPALRRVLVVTGALALAAATAACNPGAGRTTAATSVVHPSTPPRSPSVSEPVPTTPSPSPTGPTASPTVKPTSTPEPTSTPTPQAVIVLQRGDSGPRVRGLQARLRQIGWFEGDVTDYYGTRTAAAVRGFQAKRGYPVSGDVDEPTYAKLLSMTRRPTTDELANAKPKPVATTSWDVDPRCLTGRVMCISKTDRRLTWVIDGVPQYSFAVRFGSDELPTREGVFHVYKKKVDVISNLYHTPMPYSMFFSGGQAVHYSSNFARLGYTGASHGCVNVRDWDGVVRLYNESRIGDGVVIHW